MRPLPEPAYMREIFHERSAKPKVYNEIYEDVSAIAREQVATEGEGRIVQEVYFFWCFISSILMEPHNGVEVHKASNGPTGSPETWKMTEQIMFVLGRISGMFQSPCFYGCTLREDEDILHEGAQIVLTCFLSRSLPQKNTSVGNGNKEGERR